MLIVAIAMAAFLLLPLITNRLRLPDIIGILVAGILVGPHGIGLLERDETIQLLGTIGLLYLVFLAGLEVDLADLSRKRARAVTFGVITFLVPQVVGTVLAWLLFDFSMPTAILLGSVFSSHSFLALLIAKRLGLTEREMCVAVIGGTVITDTLALLVLAGVAQSTAGDFGPLFLGKLLLQAGAFAAVVVFGLPVLGRWFFRRVSDGGAHFAFMMTALSGCGYIAHLVGLEPIIGAFLAGLAMNRLVPHDGVLANRAFFIGNTIFVPFFLLSVGMLIDLRMVIGDVRTIEMALFMTTTVIVCKGGAAWLMRKIFGYSRGDAVIAWGLSLPQAATTLAVVLVGHKLELFDDAILNATIVMVLVTCVLGPLLVQVAGRRVAAASDQDDEQTAEDFQRILIPLSNPQSSDALLDLAIMLRRPLNDEALLPLSVASHEGAVAASERLLGASVLHLAAAEVPVKPVIRVDPSPVVGILRAKAESRSTCMILGWTGPESRWQRNFHLNRGIIDDVVEATGDQLLVVRLTEPIAVVERVVVALPLLAHAEPGFGELIADWKRVAKRLGATMTVVTAHPLDEGLRERIAAAGSKCALTFVGAEQGVAEQLAALAGPHALLVLFGCRAGTISWDGTWNRMATRLAHQVEGVSIAVAYPRIEPRHVTQTVARVTAQPPILRRAQILLGEPS
ncbi:MAG: cation:proton antiporter [Planctomycetota bacterium]|nr:cation:proton antiporter [Planctomycetota bacterium]